MNCGKTRYPSEKRAMSAALAASRKSGGLPLRVYKCPVCTGGTWWHMTKRRTWRKQKPKRTPGKVDGLRHPGPRCSCGQCAWLEEFGHYALTS